MDDSFCLKIINNVGKLIIKKKKIHGHDSPCSAGLCFDGKMIASLSSEKKVIVIKLLGNKK